MMSTQAKRAKETRAITQPVCLVGLGGHGRVLLDALRTLGAEVIGCIDPNPTAAVAPGVRVVDDDEAPTAFPPQSCVLVNGIGGVGSTERRRQIFERYKELGYRFCTVVHPSAIVAEDVVLAEGAQIMAGAVIQTGAQIGPNAIVNTRAVVEHDCRVGAHVHVAPGAVLSGGVQVGDGAHVGAGAVVIQGVRIGNGAVVGAGAAVVRDVVAGETVVGVPARVLKSAEVKSK